ncbi:hypothetical protein SAMN05216464_11841 [Mucilaginibacter pineti]|uniref:Dual OB-containing domain-containing protein n=1 Tax=Mucilaginibacter pineti TaxID=1391627 RepID=A0A1G7L5I1_9SPHI|nr:hypothetical protein [Mucilaginibacter pineti]SDF44616.1 hypothetical protein SAMN05216464_11841 [Mucilaginibacter pineti]
MKTLIVSKTRMVKGVCVGGLLYDGTGIRLLDINGHNQPSDCPYNVGEIWNLTFDKKAGLVEPHLEDVMVSKGLLLGNEKNLLTTLTDSIAPEIWDGPPNVLFDSLIQWTGNGSGYVCNRTGVPDKSVGFFRSAWDLSLDADGKHYTFQNPNPFYPPKKLSYVGLQTALPLILRGTLLRVSLARWWKPEDIEIEERCYAQLSGWYL